MLGARKAVCCWLLFSRNLPRFLSAGKQRQTKPSIVNRGESSGGAKSPCVCRLVAGAGTPEPQGQTHTQGDDDVAQLVRALQGIVLGG